MNISIKFVGNESIQNQLKRQSVMLNNKKANAEIDECENLLRNTKSSQFSREIKLQILKGIGIRIAGILKFYLKEEANIYCQIDKVYSY